MEKFTGLRKTGFTCIDRNGFRDQTVKGSAAFGMEKMITEI
jgi:hypothetical protein